MRKVFLYTIVLILGFSGCKSPEARRPVTQSSGSYINQSVERNRELVAKEEAQILEIIEKDSLHQYHTSSNGFWYYYNTKSSDTTNIETAEFGDIVTFEHSIQDLQGNTIYKEGELPTQEYAIDQEELFGGLREGLKLMKEGETVTFIFPSHKAFGYYGDKNKIGANLPIITRVTLKSLEKEINSNPN